MNAEHLKQESSQAVRLEQDIAGRLTTLGACGSRTASAVGTLRKRIDEAFPSSTLSPARGAALVHMLEELKANLKDGWSDRNAAHVVKSVGERLATAPESLAYVSRLIGEWLRAHTNDLEKFTACLTVTPPQGIEVKEVLNYGAYKEVFVARWPEMTAQPIALKHFKPGAPVRRPFQIGDAFPHPLRGHHPNIIETFVFKEGERGETFLVERLLDQTLEDGWDFGGVVEVVNLIRDMASALSFVHGHDHMHGDIKLDNVGVEAGRYILLDFGLCRPDETGDQDWSPTGNLRTRAPELLRDGTPNTARSDVWALGAVAFKIFVGRPPFIEGDEPQAGLEGKARGEAIERMAKRATAARWSSRIQGPLAERVPEYGLRRLLEDMLAHDPKKRPRARKVVERCESELGWLLRPIETNSDIGRDGEIDDLRYLHATGGLSLAGRSRRLELRETASRLGAGKLSQAEQRDLAEVVAGL